MKKVYVIGFISVTNSKDKAGMKVIRKKYYTIKITASITFTTSRVRCKIIKMLTSRLITR